MSDQRLVDDGTLTRQPRAPSTGATEDAPQISPEDAAAQFKEQYEAERRRGDAAEQRIAAEQRARQEAEARAAQSDGAAWTAQEQQIASQLQAARSVQDRAQASLEAAYNAGDGAAIAKAQRELSEASAAAVSLQGQKQWFESERARVAEEAKRAPPQQQQQTPAGFVPVRTPGGAINVSQQDKEWMDRHPRFYNDSRYYNAAINAHAALVEDGVRPGSPAYYRGLDDSIKDFEGYEAYQRGESQVPDNSNLSQRQQQRRQPSGASYGAPVSRQTTPREPANGIPSWQQVARHIGGDLTEADLREAARFAGYTKQRGYANEQAGFEAYLKDQGEIMSLERSGQDTGLRVDQAYR